MPSKTAEKPHKIVGAPYNAEEIAEFLNELRAEADTTAAQGSRFERFIQKLFKEHPGEYGSQMFEDVWRWNQEWPRKDEQGRVGDIGVDLVGQLRGSGELCAIQCKFYSGDSRLSKADIDSFITASPPGLFAKRILVTTVEPGDTCQKVLSNWGVHVITHFDIAGWEVNFANYRTDPDASLYSHTKYEPRDYQERAIRDVVEGFNKQDGPDRRGQMIMPCGVGKSVVALWIAEHKDVVPPQGHVLYLVPSIALMGQTMREWARQRRRDHQFLGVCSDSRIARTAEDADLSELAMPVTTKSKDIAGFLTTGGGGGSQKPDLTVVFSTYQSLEAITEAQKQGAPDFDLVICDEAHRTTGVEGSEFTQIHNSQKLKADRRLYMTATSRIYTDAAKKKAKKSTESLGLFSMDDEETFGPKLHQMSFKEAIDGGHLSPYEVIVLMHDGHDEAVRSYKATIDGDESQQIDAEDCAKILGCWDALADPSTDGLDPDRDTGQINQSTKFSLRRSIAFCNKIKTSKFATKYVNGLVSTRIAEADDPDQLLDCEADHIDGKMNAYERSKKIDWLRSLDSEKARVLTNARCLTEGVDVPALDAVLFLDPKQSEIDVVQAVGRVMRKAPGKEKGYIVLPVLVRPGQEIKKVINNSEFKKVWSVLRALRAHDEAFNALINTPNLPFDKLPIKIFSSRSSDDDTADGSDEATASSSAAAEQAVQAQLPFLQVHSILMDGIFEKVADKQYWPRWAAEMADHIDVIEKQINKEVADFPKVAEKHKEFLTSMQKTINGEVTENDLTEMLAQHVVTLPVFEALFRGDDFAHYNPLARAMNAMLDQLDSLGETKLRREQEERLKTFYKSVESTLAGISEKDSDSRLAILLELYENFFKIAMPTQFSQLGVAYTPLPLVDFILRSVDAICKSEFNKGLTDEGVHIIEPFVGTGTFPNRLFTIRSDPDDSKSQYLVDEKDLERKYTKELHANETLLLAYFMASIKIEEGYKLRRLEAKYLPFNGLVLTDTFTLPTYYNKHNKQLQLATSLEENSKRTLRQSKVGMRVIIGNPPWSAGKKELKEGAKNIVHPELEDRLRDTFSAKASGKQQKGVLNSYKKALRWAMDRINPDAGGIIGFVLPNSILEGTAESGIRACIADECETAWVYNLRGKHIGDGEGKNVFNIKQGVCLLILVLKPKKNGFKLFYREVDANSSASAKFSHLHNTEASGRNLAHWKQIFPTENNDWLNQDLLSYGKLLELASKKGKSKAIRQINGKANTKTTDSNPQVLTKLYSFGIITKSDNWLYSFGLSTLEARLQDALTFRESIRKKLLKSDEQKCDKLIQDLQTDSKFMWTEKAVSHLKGISNLTKDKTEGRIDYTSEIVRIVHYRPFVKQYLYYDPRLIHSASRIPYIFPSRNSQNTAITIPGRCGIGNFSVVAIESAHDLNLHRGGGGGGAFPKFIYSTEYSNLHFREESGNFFLSPGIQHSPRPASLGRTSDPTLRLSGGAMSSTREEGSDALPGIGITELTGGNQPDADGKIDNITDWALDHFREHYSDTSITKDDIWHYIYGALHAQDWRDKYASEIVKYLPRIPLAASKVHFRDFCTAGETLMTLHINYETIKPWSLKVEIDGKQRSGQKLTSESHSDPAVYRINPKMRWAKLPGARGAGHKTQDRSVLEINSRCSIIGIPAVAGNPYREEDALDSLLTMADDDTVGLSPYIVNGRTPLEWAIDQLEIATDKDSGIVDDANKWHVWAADEDAHKLVLHLLRLVRVSVETAQIVASLPDMPLADD